MDSVMAPKQLKSEHKGTKRGAQLCKQPPDSAYVGPESAFLRPFSPTREQGQVHDKISLAQGMAESGGAEKEI